MVGNFFRKIWKALGGPTAGANPSDQPKSLVFGDMYLAPATHAQDRVDAAMPGTQEIPLIVELAPPPVDPDRINYADDDGSRDYGPDPIAEYSVSVDAKGVFPPGPLGQSLTKELRALFRFPTFYVRTPKGRLTFMESSDAPSEAVSLIVGWALRGEEELEDIEAGAHEVGRWLASRPEGFAEFVVDREHLVRQYAQTQRILAVAPEYVSVLVWPNQDGGWFEGRKVWRTLHAVGLRWGTMDQFHWEDPTDQTDILFSADVDDGQLGYALPERIADGSQHFGVIRFSFPIPRTPAPLHVLQQMVRAVEATARELDARLNPQVDGRDVGSLTDLNSAVKDVIDQLEEIGVKPGSTPVCMLR